MIRKQSSKKWGYVRESDAGRCRTCGFLTKQARMLMGKWPPPRHFEIDRDERGRDIVNAFHHFYGTERKAWVYADIVCFIGAEDFVIGHGQSDKYPDPTAALIAEMDMDRGCPQWYPHKPGLSAREHYDEMQTVERERERQTHELAIAKMHTGVELKALKVHQSIAHASQAQAGATKASALIAAVAVFVGAIVVIVTSAVFNGDTTVNPTSVEPINNIEIIVPTAPPATAVPLSTPDNSPRPD